jgi:NAD-dependent SIR2 family protein deacetylase
MPECENCGGFVTDQYVRVFAPTGMTTVRVCPNCPDLLRDNGTVREAKSPRDT